LIVLRYFILYFFKEKSYEIILFVIVFLFSCEVNTLIVWRGSQMKFLIKVRLRPWLHQEGLKINLERSEVSAW